MQKPPSLKFIMYLAEDDAFGNRWIGPTQSTGLPP